MVEVFISNFNATLTVDENGISRYEKLTMRYCTLSAMLEYIAAVVENAQWKVVHVNIVSDTIQTY